MLTEEGFTSCFATLNYFHHEQGVLTGCDVAIIMHNADNGKTFEYSSQKMEQVLCNYGTYSGPLERRTTERVSLLILTLTIRIIQPQYLQPVIMIIC